MPNAYAYAMLITNISLFPCKKIIAGNYNDNKELVYFALHTILIVFQSQTTLYI